MDFVHLKNGSDSLLDGMLPGGALSVSIHDRPAFEYGAGFSDEENGIEAGGDTLYSAYSMTKPLTACLTLRAFEQGRLDLDAPLNEYLKEFKKYRLLVVDAGGKRVIPYEGSPTVRQLLNMSAGFGEDMALVGSAPTREAISALAHEPLLFDCGTRWVYGLCYEVLGAVLEEVCGGKLRDIFRREIFEPCGMKDSCFLSEIRDLSSIAPVYREKSGSYVSAPLDRTYAPHPGYDSAGAGLVTSAVEYDRFLRALMHGRLLKAGTLALMKRDTLNDAMRRDFNWPQTQGYGYGLGIRVPPAGSGLNDYGWGGAAGAYCLMDFERDVSLCFFTNVLGADEAVLYPLLREAFYADLRGE